MYKFSKNLTLVLFIVSLLHTTVQADDLIMLRSDLAFPETMLALQDAIKKTGNTVSRVQLIDVGLAKMGYKSDKYRIVFYGKADEIKMLAAQYPELIPYLPLKIALFSENGQTLLTTTNPEQLSAMYPNKALKPIFLRWAKNIRVIMAEVQHATNDE